MDGKDVMEARAVTEVVVETRARLHIGFLDLNFELGRKFGSLGLAIERPVTRLRLTPSERLSVTGADTLRVAALLDRLDCAREPISLMVERAIPSHAGLGSGTQLALAVGSAIAAWRGERIDARAISERLDRGARSGVGIGVFERGGFVVDGGRGGKDGPAPVIARLAFPAAWRILLIFDASASGIHGEEERSAFQNMPPAPAATAGEFCRRTLMQILPALIEEDLPAFSEGVAALQKGMGKLFAPYQGGQVFRSRAVREALAWLASEGVYGAGQSSWGPTGFAFVADAQATSLLERARHRFAGETALSFDLVSGCNTGASVTCR